MKILHINSQDKGGAFKACFRLHKGLLELGTDSEVLILNGLNDLEHKVYKFSKNDFNKIGQLKYTLAKRYCYRMINRLLQNRDKDLEIFSMANSFCDITGYSIFKKADIINLHWTAGFLDYKSFFRNNKKKIIWTLHDMNPFTGGCHYSNGCNRFQENCSNCPQLSGTIDPNCSKEILASKLKAIRNNNPNLTIVSPSQWLLDLSKSSVLFKDLPHFHISNSVEKDIYKPNDTKYSKRVLSIPENKKVILFVADVISNKRKGYQYLLNILENINSYNEIILCSVGSNAGDIIPNQNILNMGKIEDQRLMSIVYSAADAFVIPSLEDNSPNTVIESLMCGTPVIGFPVGGIKEMIIHGQNGTLCEEISQNSLEKEINRFFVSFDRFNRENISNKAKALYNQSIQAEKYLEVYSNDQR